MKKDALWRSLIGKLPPGLTVKQATAYLSRPYTQVRRWIKRYKYEHADGRAVMWTEKRRRKRRRIAPERVDWTMPNVVISRITGVTRERVRQIRNELGLPKV